MYGKKYHIIDDPNVVSEYSDMQEVREMPVYPKSGYCQTVDEYTIVKLEDCQD